MIEILLGFLIGTFLMLPIFKYGKNFYLFIIELMRERYRARRTKVKEVDMKQ